MTEVTRRLFLKLAAGSGAAAAADLASKQLNKLVPYVQPPEEVRPGVWTLFATTCRECPAGCGMHVRHVDGRAIKSEGNPTHFVNRGGLCPRGQSAVQGLYDPDRMRMPLFRPDRRRGLGDHQEWEQALPAIAEQLKRSGGKIVLVSDLQTGSLAALMGDFLSAFGSDRLHFYEAFNYEPLRRANELVFDKPAIPHYRLDACDFILSLSADFLETWVSPVEFARQFATMHSLEKGKIGRFAYVGPRLSMTAGNADDYYQVPPGGDYAVAVEVLNIILREGWTSGAIDVAPLKAPVQAWAAQIKRPSGISAQQVRALAQSFSHAQTAVALAGEPISRGQTAVATAVVAQLLNYVTGRLGQTVDFSRTHALGSAATARETRLLVESISPDDILILHNVDLVYTLPSSKEQIQLARQIIYLGTLMNETAELADWVLPTHSPMECWGDYEPWSGVHGLMQPTTARVFDTCREPGDILLGLAAAAGKAIPLPHGDAPAATFEEYTRHRWEMLRRLFAPDTSAEQFWQEALSHGGVVEEPRAVPISLQEKLGGFAPPATTAEEPSTATAAEHRAVAANLWVWPSIMFYDGRLANRGWLQEVHDPVSTVVWNSWIEVHPVKARQLGLYNGDVIELRSEAAAVEAAVRITEEIDEQTVGIAFGQGHKAMGRNAANRGANAFLLLMGRAPEGIYPSVSLKKLDKNAPLVYISNTQEQFNRDILQWAPLSQLRKMKPGDGDHLTLPLPEGYSPTKDIYPPHEYPNHRWAMAIDLQRCIGCGACTVACYAENNIPVMGEERDRKYRQMAWLRVVPYRHEEQPMRVAWLPMLCQQCDAAPCEPVCPVFASVHNEEGLNAQVFNRCIGTRYCSNNCPYKVRRFNWFNNDWPHPLEWQLNPEVTARSRGVMEKCTFCIQRIKAAELQAKREGRSVRDGEIKPACLQSCPTRAFVFGDLLDGDSEVSKLTRLEPRRYHVLEELNVKPAVTYLRRILNDEESS